MSFDKNYKQILESFGSIRTINRIFYPRNFNLSPQFIHAFKMECKRLKDMGLKDKQILIKLSKALHFHCKD